MKNIRQPYKKKSYKQLEYLIHYVQERFQKSYPSGLVEKWPEDRYIDDIASIIPHSWKVGNMTDFNCDFSNQYVLYQKNNSKTKNKNYSIFLEISFVADVFSIEISPYSQNAIDKPTHEGNMDQKNIVNLKYLNVLSIEMDLRNLLLKKDFIEFPKEWKKVLVPEVKLDLSEFAYLYNCLFQDQ